MLLIDAGNSSIKAQWWRGSALSMSFGCRYQGNWQAFFEARLAEVEARHCFYTMGQVDELESGLLAMIHRAFDTDATHRFVSMAEFQGVRNAYPLPESLGVDRWLCLLAAARIAPGDAIIVDAGSAITIDLLRGDGQHLGGAILPGFNTSLERFKQILHRADFDHPDIARDEDPGCSTEACIRINYGPTDAAVVEGLIARWRERLSSDAVLIVTGGDAARVIAPPGCERRVLPDLVFRGMRRQLESQE